MFFFYKALRMKIMIFIKSVSIRRFDMVAFFCHHLSDNYVDLSDLLPCQIFMLTCQIFMFIIHLLENKSKKGVLAQSIPTDSTKIPDKLT